MAVLTGWSTAYGIVRGIAAFPSASLPTGGVPAASGFMDDALSLPYIVSYVLKGTVIEPTFRSTGLTSGTDVRPLRRKADVPGKSPGSYTRASITPLQYVLGPTPTGAGPSFLCCGARGPEG